MDVLGYAIVTLICVGIGVIFGWILKATHDHSKKL